jgi:transcriptional regulator of acetoin/glycerol metabolism
MPCATLPEEIMLAEMFGREQETHVGARPGKLELADKGTLFLDEIANLTRTAQEKLLQVMEHKKFEKIGGLEAFEVDVHLITASNASLEEMREKGEFLPELYNRLTFAELALPPLRRERLRARPTLPRAHEALNMVINSISDLPSTGKALSVYETLLSQVDQNGEPGKNAPPELEGELDFQKLDDDSAVEDELERLKRELPQV